MSQNDAYQHLESSYIHILEARAIAVCHFLNRSEAYSPWKNNWKMLEKNLNKTKVTFDLLKESDQDVAYVMDKGASVNFKLRDTDGYIPISVYQYVLFHEMAHMSTKVLQHPPEFWDLLSIICAAAFELKFFNVNAIDTIKTNMGEVKLTTTKDIKESIEEGFMMIVNENPKYKEYYKNLLRATIQK